MLFLLLSLLVSFEGAQYVVNGDFEQELSVGWKEVLNGAGASITRSTTYDPDPDWEVQVYKSTGGGYTLLSQNVYIPTTDVVFAANTKIYAHATSTAWAGAALILKYLDSNGSLLGETRICAKTGYCPWTNSPIMHLIEVPDSLWHNYTFNIQTELANLTGVNPADVRQIEIALFDSTYDC